MNNATNGVIRRGEGADPTPSDPGILHTTPEPSAALALAMKLAAAHPRLRLDLFELDWESVDAARIQLMSAGLSDRVGIHHRDAFYCTSVRAAIAVSRSILLFPS